LASAAKVPDFSSRDIFLPTSQRTRIILSALINFIKFSEQCAPIVQGVRKKAEDLAQDTENMMRERARLEMLLAQLQCVSSAYLSRASDFALLYFQGKAKIRRT